MDQIERNVDSSYKYGLCLILSHFLFEKNLNIESSRYNTHNGVDKMSKFVGCGNGEYTPLFRPRCCWGLAQDQNT